MAKKKPVKKVVEKDVNVAHTIGKRKRAIARSVIKPGKGVVKVNSQPLSVMKNEIARMRIEESLILAGPAWKGYDISVNVKGGGVMGQADAVRQAISRGLVALVPDLKEKYLKYDRFMIVYDPRRTEPHKPPRSSQGPRRYKQKSKR